MLQLQVQKGGDHLRDFGRELKNFFRKGDMVLLVMCLAISAFGCLMIASTNNYRGFTRYVAVQVAAIGLGVLFYAIMSSIDLDFFSEHRLGLTAFSLFLLFLLIPFGTDLNSGNKSWLDFGPLFPVNIQPAEICKILYILINASILTSHQNHVSSIRSVFHAALYLIVLVGVNLLISRDLGVSLIFVFIFIGMAFAGGVKMIWFILCGGALVGIAPFLWSRLDLYQQKRILVLFDPTIDPQGIKERYHMIRSLKSLTGGGIAGQGLFEGNRTQAGGVLPAQHTDFIFSAIGEELGYLGCALVIIMMFCLVARCIWVGSRSTDYMRRMVCFGAASALIFQVCVNVGMCIGIVPVIGLTLPLISYGGSSIVTIFAMLGLVSGVHARPSPRSHERYIQPPR